MVTLRSPMIAPGVRINLPILRQGSNQLRMPKKLLHSICSSFTSNIHQSPSSLPSDDQSVAAIIFGNGAESELCPLTRRRSAGAIPLAGTYRLIDAVVSNCINSNITKIYVLTQYNSTSLNSHLSRAYSNAGFGKEGLLEVIAACQSPGNQSWFQGDADAVRRFLWMLKEYPVNEFLLLPGYHLCKMDYKKLLHFHQEKEADITITALRSEKIQDKGFGILKVNSEAKVVELIQTEGRLVEDSDNCTTFASMGIYVFNKDVLIKILTEHFPLANDFRREVIPGAISSVMKVQAYMFDGYWENMGSIKAFYEANMEFTKTNIRYGFYDRDFPIYSLPRRLPPTMITDALIMDSIIGDGCVLNGCRIRSSVLGLRTRIENGVVIEDSILMGSDFYQEDLLDRDMNKKELIIPIGIGEGSVIRKAIVDKNARIGKRVMITNKGNIVEGNMEDQGYVIRDGIVIVIKGAIILDGIIL